MLMAFNNLTAVAFCTEVNYSTDFCLYVGWHSAYFTISCVSEVLNKTSDKLFSHNSSYIIFVKKVFL